MKTRNMIGTVATGSWLAFALVLAYLNRDDWPHMALNEWGDFFAGMVAPLAFFWLIIGYWQQGEEVRANTDTLRQQQQALQRQVEETAKVASNSAEQVRVATERLELERQQVERQRRKDKARIQPVFTYVSGRGGSSAANYQVDYKNNGGLAKAITFVGADPPCVVTFNPTDAEPGGAGYIGLDKITSYPTKVTIAYLDQDNEEQRMVLEFYVPGKFRASPLWSWQ